MILDLTVFLIAQIYNLLLKSDFFLAPAIYTNKPRMVVRPSEAYPLQLP